LKGNATASEIHRIAFQTFKKYAQAKFPNIEALVKDAECLKVDFHQINSYGFAEEQSEACNPQRIIMIRMQLNNIQSQVKGDEELGSIVYANSFIIVDDVKESQIFINVTENVPNLQFWFTNIAHHENLPIEINIAKNLDCEHLGEKLLSKTGDTLYKDIIGLLPIKDEYTDAFDDVPLNGKMLFYQRGFIFIDNRLHALVMPYEQIKNLNFYVNRDELWLEVEPLEEAKTDLQSKNLLPGNLICKSKFYLKITKKFLDDKFKLLEKELMINKEEKESKAKKFDDTDCPYVLESQVMNNYIKQQKWNPQYSCEFLNLSFQLDKYKEYMEFAAVNEFNKIKGKDFMPFSAFTKVYQEADQMAGMPLSKTKNLIEKLMNGTDKKTSLIIVSGIPGSGKGRLSDYLSRKLVEEDVESTYFKMPTVQDSLSYSSESFIKALVQFKRADSKA
jgi:hypothetical protein